MAIEFERWRSLLHRESGKLGGISRRQDTAVVGAGLVES